MGFITQLTNMILAVNTQDGINLLETPRWNKYVHVILKRTNKREEIGFQMLKRPSTRLSQDLDEDTMLKGEFVSDIKGKSEDLKAAEASTTPELREKALKLKKKLLNIDDEVNKVPSLKRRAVTITPSMNPVYNDLIRKFEATKRFNARMEAMSRGDGTPTAKRRVFF